jgi:hypothetical protein
MTGVKVWFRVVASLMAVVIGLVAVSPGVARAALVSTEQMLAGADGVADRARVLAFLDRDEVRERIVALGVDPAEAAARVGALSDAQVAEIAAELDRLPAGQSAIGAIIGAMLIIFLILLVTDLLGLTDIFPFVKR